MLSRLVDQIFPVSPGVTATPTFADRITLAPGKYLVEANLYAVSPGFNPATLEDAEASRHMVSLSGVKKVVVEAL